MKLVRCAFTHTNKKLRRARRLYAFLLRGVLKDNPTLIWYYGQIAIDRGLYSQTTGLHSAAWSLTRYVYRAEKSREWFNWADRTGFWAALKYRKRGKPVVRWTLN